jgi:hypothetical protein
MIKDTIFIRNSSYRSKTLGNSVPLTEYITDTSYLDLIYLFIYSYSLTYGLLNDAFISSAYNVEWCDVVNNELEKCARDKSCHDYGTIYECAGRD